MLQSGSFGLRFCGHVEDDFDFCGGDGTWESGNTKQRACCPMFAIPMSNSF